MILPAIRLGILTDEIALAHQAVDFVGCIGLRDVKKIRKLADCGSMQQVYDFQRERFHRCKRTVTFANLVKNPAEKLKFEPIENVIETFLNHDETALSFQKFLVILFYSLTCCL